MFNGHPKVAYAFPTEGGRPKIFVSSNPSNSFASKYAPLDVIMQIPSISRLEMCTWAAVIDQNRLVNGFEQTECASWKRIGSMLIVPI